jgi:hypothetical protein
VVTTLDPHFVVILRAGIDPRPVRQILVASNLLLLVDEHPRQSQGDSNVSHSIPNIDAPPPPYRYENYTAGGQALQALSESACRSAFSSVLPKLQAVFESIRHQDDNLLEHLEDNIAELQENFAELLHEQLLRREVDLSEKITLRLDNNARLVLVGEHPDSASILGLLGSHEEFSLAFAEIAAQSAALRDLRSLTALLLGTDSAGSMYASLNSLPGENTYQVSLKGEMNHFYFTR